MKHRSRSVWLGAGLVALATLAGLAVALAIAELQTSRLQSRWLRSVVRGASFSVEPGPSDAIRFPGSGPYDQRLGYRGLPDHIERLQAQGYVVTAQARMSPQLIELHDRGLFALYREKSQAGLALLDCRNESLLHVQLPQRAYRRFEAVPPLLVGALLYIEDRHLLDPHPSRRNPAIDPERLARAMVEQARHAVDPAQAAAGGSTLATQIEKYRHSPHGRTDSAAEKLRQMASASLRSYLDGENTLARRRQIVVDYLDTVPLAARLGVGEVHGLGDGMWAWYGREFDEVNRLLTDSAEGAAPGSDALHRYRQALAFKQALSLLIAQRRPAQYLLGNDDSLLRLTDSYLRLLASAGVVTPALRDAALPLPLRLQADAPAVPRPDYVQQKAANATRAALSALLDVPRPYDLDRLDLEVQTSLDGRSQALATRLLRSLKVPAEAKAAGLVGPHLLADGADPSRLVFSLTLFERAAHANRLRIQADSIDRPFDVNEGARLDLGSTAKLRSLVSYLEVIAELHARWARLPPADLAALAPNDRDPLAAWAKAYLLRVDDRGLGPMLEAALARRYSANPAEAFFTGGGLHHFDNFDPEHDSRSMTVREGFIHSVNLVFIRLMRDVVRHRMFGDAAADDARRHELLMRFADREGSTFLARFYRKYQGRSPAQARALLLGGLRPSPPRLASVLFTIDPQAGDAQLDELLRHQLGRGAGSPRELHALRNTYAHLSLADRGYVAGVHPLELWLVGFLQRYPGASLREVLDASRNERQDVYAWLFKTRRRSAQDLRIHTLLEVDAFAQIHRSWRRLGYPFESLTPSYASAIGASGDRPAALAELMGIIANGGTRLPTQRIDALRFAHGTPYETWLEWQGAAAERVLEREIADTLRRVLAQVVEQGTARRLKGALLGPDGAAIQVGGKTGTGDHRSKSIGRDGRVIAERVLSRSATFVFVIDERYFGTLMAYVQGPDAERYRFTSALPVQLLKALAPPLLASLQRDACRSGTLQP